MIVLCVAEKSSIAKSITQILSGGQYNTINSHIPTIKNYRFDYPKTRATFIVTYVAGHLTELDFTPAFKSWHACDPFQLFDAPTVVEYPGRSKDFVRNLQTQARSANKLMIWTDCDREGEHIGSEIVTVCRKSNGRISIERARFSAIIPQQIHHAAQNPVPLDMLQANAVDARQALDLRIGAAFTRMQTLALQARFAQLFEGKVVSYGPCQFPTLGFVVTRYEQVQSFVSEPFWYIYLTLSRTGEAEEEKMNVFSWKRGNLFDYDVAYMLYEMVLEHPEARITKVTNNNVKKWKPLPLTTVELQKTGSRMLKMTPKQILDIAESLYQQGILSYPRTETDQFDPQFDFQSLIEKQTANEEWGAFATRLRNGDFSTPRKGKRNDKAHPPIHPTAHAGNLTGNDKRVYEFITRRFLACCSKDAEGHETNVEVTVNGEEFSATGLVILARNYLEVYPYDKWTTKPLPSFTVGEMFMPTICELREGATTAPSLLTEADLVGLMDKNGIGTDATIAQHIETIIKREYVMPRMEGGTKYLVPSTLGIGLIEGYNLIGFEKSLSKPQLRRETERSMVQVCEGQMTKNDMLVESIDQYKEVYILAKRDFQKVMQSVQLYVEGGGDRDNRDAGGRRGRGRGNGGGGRGPGPGPGPGPSGNSDDDDDSFGNNGGATGRGRGRGQSARSVPTTRGRGRGRGRGRPPAAGRVIALSPDNDFAPLPPPPARRPTPPLQRPRPPTISDSNSDHPNCDCNTPAVKRTVQKEGVNKGRNFWKCGGGPEKDCDFFAWADGNLPPNSRTVSNSDIEKMVPAKRKHPDRPTDGPSRRCFCDLTAVQKTVLKEGANKGRQFWCCPNHESARCKFFEWDDEPPRNDTGGGRESSNGVFGDGSRIQNGAMNGSGAGECFRCGEVGHWSNSCTKQVASGSGSGGGGGTSGECFKCGREGHWSNACPNATEEGRGSSTVKRARTESFQADPSSRSGGRGGVQGECYKCHQPGHWANACPNEEGGGYEQQSGGRNTKTRTRGRGSTKRGRGRRGRGSLSKKGSFDTATGDDWD